MGNKLRSEKCFILISERDPPKNGDYEVITNKGRVITCKYENFIGNNIWETKYENHEINEHVIAWRFLKKI